MKAVRIHGYGDVGVLTYEDAPIPEIGPDEVLIKVHAAGVNHIDVVARKGFLKGEIAQRLPLIPGWDIAGTVERAGPLVGRFSPGDAVFTRPDLARDGGYAEYVAVRGDEVAYAPKSLSLAQAAAVPHAALTAWKALFETANLRAGQSVLIHAGAGIVGGFAIQLAKLAGARIIATASAANIDLVRSLGADRVIDYRNQDFAAEVKDLDVVLDTMGGETRARSWGVLRRGGVLALTLRSLDAAEAERRGVSGRVVLNAANGARLQEISALVDAGKLAARVGREFPLREAAAAQELVATGHASGKIILRIA